MSITRTSSREEVIHFINGFEYEDRYVARVIEGHLDEWIAEIDELKDDKKELERLNDELEEAAVEDDRTINMYHNDIITLETEKEFLEDDVERLEEEVKELAAMNNNDWRP